MKTLLKTFLPSLALGALCLTATTGQATTVANFSDGAGATPDGYVGSAGNGWGGAWITTLSASPNNPTAVGTVSTATPVNGGGNYLSYSVASVSTAANTAALSRAYSNNGTNGSTVDFTQSLTYKFDFRVDTLPAGFSSTGDYFAITDRSGGGDVSTSSTWAIKAAGLTSGGLGTATWGFYNGAAAGAAISDTNYVSSGITLTAGTTYTFTINSEPTTRSYTATLTDGTSTFNSLTLGYETASFSATGTYSIFDRLVGTNAENRTFSLDNLSIIGVPEPSSCVFLALGAALSIRRRRMAA